MDKSLQFAQSSQKIVDQLKEDLKQLRSGRATPGLIETIQVKTYGGTTALKLMELATITTDGPSALVINQFDPATVADIEKALQTSVLGFNPQTQGSTITVRIPPLSQEQREKIFKIIGQKIEERKVQIRGHRDDARKKLRSQLDAKDITEDDKFRAEKEIDVRSAKFAEEIAEIKQKKEDEIMQV